MPAHILFALYREILPINQTNLIMFYTNVQMYMDVDTNVYDVEENTQDLTRLLSTAKPIQTF